MSALNGHLDVYNSYWITTSLERQFDYYSKRKWLKENHHLPFVIIMFYLLIVFSVRRLMVSRDALNLKKVLIMWNFCLALFSIMGSFRTIPHALDFILKHGYHASMCTEGDVSGVYGFWCWVFIMSKIPELGDTVFIVVRKQKLIFLHWFHHLSVLILVWYSNIDEFSVGRYFMTMNFFVHSLMYSYYFVKSIGIRVPKIIPIIITTSQLTQMLAGLYITCYVCHQKLSGIPCQTHPRTLYISLSLYLAYSVLFANFFIRSYLKSSPSVSLAVEKRAEPLIRRLVDLKASLASTGAACNNNQVMTCDDENVHEDCSDFIKKGL